MCRYSVYLAGRDRRLSWPSICYASCIVCPGIINVLIVGAGGLGLWTLRIAEYAVGSNTDRVRLTVADSNVRLSLSLLLLLSPFDAKRGIAIACRLSVRQSVRLSVTLVDQEHIYKLIARTISPTPPLLLAQRPFTYSQGNVGKFWRDYRWGGKKWRAGPQKQQYL